MHITPLRNMLQYRDDRDDEFLVSEYKDEIFEYTRKLQDEMLPNPNYIEAKQKDTCVTWKMRSELILWVVKTHFVIGLQNETLFLAVNYIDRFLSLKDVQINRLRLVGRVALSIATKFEERKDDIFHELMKKRYTDKNNGEADVYTAENFRAAEVYMLDKLQYKLAWPGPLIFLRRINIEVDGLDDRVRNLAEYFVEAILPDRRFVAWRSSFTAAAAYCLARYFLDKGHWTSSYVHVSGYNYIQLYPLMVAILQWLSQDRKCYQAIYDKYNVPNRFWVTKFVLYRLKDGFSLEDQCSNSKIAAESDTTMISDDIYVSAKSGTIFISDEDLVSAELDTINSSDEGWDSDSSSDIFFSARAR